MTAPPSHDELRERMLPELPPGLIAHIDRVVALTGELTGRHGGDRALAGLMAQGHDLLRALPPAELLRRAEARGQQVDAVERTEPVLLHGPLGALELRERFGIGDERVLHAVTWHSTGHPDYGPEAWAMFVADKVEPQKVADWPELAAVRELADASLTAAALAFLDLALHRATRERWQVHPMANTTRNWLLRAERADSR